MIEEISYHGWKALRLSTGSVNLILLKDVGPRIIHASLGDEGRLGENLFAENETERGGCEEVDWKIRGGHRLWLAPEHPLRTYQPDNSPIESLVKNDSLTTVVLRGNRETVTGMRKSIEVGVLNETTLKVTHHLTNEGAWPVEASAWALTVMKYGGYGVIPFLPVGHHPADLLPRHSLIPWSYTDLGSPLWRFRSSHIGIETKANQVSQKLGISQYPGWTAYWQEQGTFAKFSPVQPLKGYPDLGCAYETYACDWMLEMETLSPLEQINPGATLSHTEYWGFFDSLRRPETEEIYVENFRPIIQHWLEHTPA